MSGVVISLAAARHRRRGAPRNLAETEERLDALERALRGMTVEDAQLELEAIGDAIERESVEFSSEDYPAWARVVMRGLIARQAEQLHRVFGYIAGARKQVRDAG